MPPAGATTGCARVAKSTTVMSAPSVIGASTAATTTSHRRVATGPAAGLRASSFREGRAMTTMLTTR